MNKLKENYWQSSTYGKVIIDINEQLDKASHQRFISEEKSVVKRSFRREFYHISKRTLINSFRNPALFMTQIFVTIMMGVLTGLVFFDMKKTIDVAIPNRLGAIFFIVVSQVFSTVTALEPLLKERVLFIHVS